MKKHRRAIPYEEGLYQDLKNPEEAALYLNATFKECDADLILLAMHDIAKARGMTQIAETIKVHRVSLHRMLRKNGSPTFRTFLSLMGQFELQLSVSKAA